MSKCLVHPIMLVLFVSMLINALGWAFNGEVFVHELDRKHHTLSLDPVALHEAHELEVSNDSKHIDAAINLCLHEAGQYQPFFFTAALLVPPSIGMETVTQFVSIIFPESIPDSPLHPPRNTLIS